MKINRVILIIMDSVGVGAMPDAANYDDEGANTVENIYKARGSLNLPNLTQLGLGNIVNIGYNPANIQGCYGKMAETCPGKDTTSGHWEMMGIDLDFNFPTYPDGFPDHIIKKFEEAIGTKTIGNYARSGTEILLELGEEHYKTGYPIVYTSADSVFQIAANEDIVPLEKLYEYCRIAREILTGPDSMGRVIARPFIGKPGNFSRNEGARKDFSLFPPDDTLLDILKASGAFVAGLGKIGDIFCHRGTTEEAKGKNNMENVDLTLQSMEKYKAQKGLIFTNLVDFDSMYGHRRTAEGYGQALEALDMRIPEIMQNLADDDLLILTADHGCDPTHEGHTDHTREYVPLLVYGKQIQNGVDLGIRKSFADCGKTIADIFGVELKKGKSFKNDIQ